MTADVPRRLPPAPQQRTKTILTHTRGAPSSQGSVSAARPVDPPRPGRRYNPVAPGGVSAVKVGDTSGAAAAEVGGVAIAIESTTSENSTSTTVASGIASIAIGVDCEAGGNQAISVGYGCKAEGRGGVSLGFDAYTWNDRAIGIGESAQVGTEATAADHNNGAAIGFGAQVFGTDSIAVGTGAVVGTGTTPANTSVAIGAGATATAEHQIVLGTPNEAVIIRGQLVLQAPDLGLWAVVVDNTGALSTVAYP